MSKDEGPRKVVLLKFEWTDQNRAKTIELQPISMRIEHLNELLGEPKRLEDFFRPLAHTVISDFGHKRPISLLAIIEVSGKGSPERLRPKGFKLIYTFPQKT